MKKFLLSLCLCVLTATLSTLGSSTLFIPLNTTGPVAPRLWSAEKPNLYTLAVGVGEGHTLPSRGSASYKGKEKDAGSPVGEARPTTRGLVAGNHLKGNNTNDKKAL
jgi:hypothetical protein